MKVRLYNFSKRIKETLQPTNSTSYDEKDLNLKDGCEVTNPVLLYQSVISPAYNYAYIPSWNRYYFITEGRFVDGMFEIYLHEDYLASNKTAIGSTSANILYATGSTKNIVDSRIPVLADVDISHDSSSLSGITILDQGGNNVVGITGKGSFGAYVCNNINELLDDVDNWWGNLNISNVWDALQQFIYGGSAAECLKSAIRIPLTWTETVGPTESIYLGNYPAKDDGGNAITGDHVIQPIVSGSCNISIPWQTSKPAWTKTSQYSSVFLYLPLIGVITLPASELQGDQTITIQYKVNVTSGDISVIYTGGTSGKHFGTASGNIAQNTAFGSTGIDTNKETQAIVTGVGAIATAATLASAGLLTTAASIGIGAAFAKAAADSMMALGGTGYGSGGLGGGASNGLDKNVHCWVVTKKLAETPANLNALIGKPYMGVATVGSFAGFVQTDGFQLASATAYSSEIEAVNRMLDSGIYYT